MKVNKYLVMLIVMVVLGCVITANKKSPDAICTHPEKKESTLPTPREMSKPSKKLKLTTVLYELAIAPNREKVAKEHDISLSEGTVRVFISFDPSSPNADIEALVKTYNIVVEKKSTNLFRALVPIDRLIPLSKESPIWSIRLPDRPIQ